MALSLFLMKSPMAPAGFLLLFVLGGCVVHAFPAGDGWGWVSSMPDLTGTQFRDIAYPLVQISANAYRYPAGRPLQAIPGWSLSSRIGPLQPSHGGAHALSYEEAAAEAEDGGSMAVRIIVAFRGTVIDSSPSIDALTDACADALLWENLTMSSLPPDCALFDAPALDYFAQALNYTLQVVQAYPSSPILLTGHSLGAGLAIMVCTALVEMHGEDNGTAFSVIGFGAPATQKPLLDRGLSLESLNDGSIVVIGHEWDEVMRIQWEGQVGMLCMYPQPLPSSCKACFLSRESAREKPVLSLTSSMNALKRRKIVLEGGLTNTQGRLNLPEGDCLDCFFETHYLKQLIALVDQGVRPVCQLAIEELMEAFSSESRGSEWA